MCVKNSFPLLVGLHQLPETRWKTTFDEAVK